MPAKLLHRDQHLFDAIGLGLTGDGGDGARTDDAVCLQSPRLLRGLYRRHQFLDIVLATGASGEQVAELGPIGLVRLAGQQFDYLGQLGMLAARLHEGLRVDDDLVLRRLAQRGELVLERCELLVAGMAQFEEAANSAGVRQGLQGGDEVQRLRLEVVVAGKLVRIDAAAIGVAGVAQDARRQRHFEMHQIGHTSRHVIEAEAGRRQAHGIIRGLQAPLLGFRKHLKRLRGPGIGMVAVHPDEVRILRIVRRHRRGDVLFGVELEPFEAGPALAETRARTGEFRRRRRFGREDGRKVDAGKRFGLVVVEARGRNLGQRDGLGLRRRRRAFTLDLPDALAAEQHVEQCLRRGCLGGNAERHHCSKDGRRNGIPGRHHRHPILSTGGRRSRRRPPHCHHTTGNPCLRRDCPPEEWVRIARFDGARGAGL